MAKTGQEIYNPRQKDRIIFKKTARETGGELLQMELFASPNAAPPPDHDFTLAKRSTSRPSPAPFALAWAARSVPYAPESAWWSLRGWDIPSGSKEKKMHTCWSSLGPPATPRPF